MPSKATKVEVGQQGQTPLSGSPAPAVSSIANSVFAGPFTEANVFCFLSRLSSHEETMVPSWPRDMEVKAARAFSPW